MASVTWLGHATALVELGATRLLTDPVLRPRVAHLVRVADAAAIPAHVDAVLLSHLHRDHADIPTLRRMPGVPLIAAPGATRLLAGTGTGPVRELRPGEETRVGELTVRATPAEHDGRRHPLAASGQALGFLIEAPQQRVYFAGDTDIFAGMAELADPQIDVALLPVWGWGRKLGPGHLDPVRAARAVALLQPRIVVPIHWGTYSPMTPRRRPLLRDDPARAFAALVGRASPAVEVVVLAPGETLELT